MKRIAIQGELGSFHDITARHCFEGDQLQIICCSTFEDVIQNMKQDPTVIGIMAIENTIENSAQPNATKILRNGMFYILRDGVLYNAQGMIIAR